MKRAIQRIMSCLLAAVVCLAIFTNTTSAATGATETVSIEVEYRQTEARSMIGLINDLRTGENAWYWTYEGEKYNASGLSTLDYDYGLEQIAMQRAAEIAIYFGHTRPNYEAYFDTNWGIDVYAENITVGNGDAESTFAAWAEGNAANWDGQSNRRSMLNSSYTAVGIACAYYNGTYYWVQIFGDSSGTPETVANNSSTTVEVDVHLIFFAPIFTPDTESLAVTLGGSISLPSITSLLEGAYVTVDFTWKIEDTSIAEISDGSIIGLSLGETKLIATAFGESVEFVLTVQEVAAETNEETGTGGDNSSTGSTSGTTGTTSSTTDTTSGTTDTTSDTTDTTSDAGTTIAAGAQTGDAAGLALWTALLLVSVFISIIAATTLKKRSRL